MRNSLKWRNAGDLVALGTALPLLGAASAASPRDFHRPSLLFTLGGFIRKRRQRRPPTEKRPKGNESSVCWRRFPPLALWPSAAAAAQTVTDEDGGDLSSILPALLERNVGQRGAFSHGGKVSGDNFGPSHSQSVSLWERGITSTMLSMSSLRSMILPSSLLMEEGILIAEKKGLISF